TERRKCGVVARVHGEDAVGVADIDATEVRIETGVVPTAVGAGHGGGHLVCRRGVGGEGGAQGCRRHGGGDEKADRHPRSSWVERSGGGRVCLDDAMWS